MKKLMIAVALLSSMFFTSCSSNDEVEPTTPEASNPIYDGDYGYGNEAPSNPE